MPHVPEVAARGGRQVADLCREPAAGPKLLSVGRLIPHKGHATVINALPGLLRLWPDLSYTCIGEGPQESRLAALARDLGISDRVHFRKGLSLEELKAAYSNDVDILLIGMMVGPRKSSATCCRSAFHC